MNSISSGLPRVVPAAGRTEHWHLLWPLPVGVLACLLLWVLQCDLWWADCLHAWQGGGWLLREHWLTEALIHQGGKYASLAAWLLLAGLAVAAPSRLRAWRRPLWVLLASVLVSVTVVALLKRGSGVACPWDLLRYGGSLPYHLPWSASALPGSGGCFPAGHASGGYAWVALYFFFARVAPRWRRPALAAALLLGALFGFSQQLRGAHFLSHDIVTLTLCWCVAWSLDALFGEAGKPLAGAGR
ncbi:phosphatase PAP2 family protein [Luteimonas sp. e5]